MTETNEILKKINIENNIWIIYLIIIGLSFYSNAIEKNYYIYNDLCAKEKYRILNIIIFSIALVVYCYFFKDSYDSVKNINIFDNKKKKTFKELSFLASTLILISGVILLYIAIFDTNLDTELAFS
ncbi:MAG: hypothetical protein IJF92_04165 [Bacilli bacterium]|nr:hypothetical protein [Bacilli bacterium]